MELLEIVLATGWAGEGSGPTPTGTEPSSAIIALLLTAAVLLWGRRIERGSARKILPFRRAVR
jgi:hypothetical protein